MIKENESLCKKLCNNSDLAEILGLSIRRVQQLTKDETIRQQRRGRYVLGEAVQDYIKFVRSNDTMRGTATALAPETSYNVEKAGLTRIQKEQAELKLKNAKGEVHRSEDIKALVGGMIVTTRSRLLDIPNKLGPKLLGKKDLDAVKDAIEAEIVLALQSLVDYDPELYIQRSRDYKGDTDDVDSSGTYTKEDS